MIARRGHAVTVFARRDGVRQCLLDGDNYVVALAIADSLDTDAALRPRKATPFRGLWDFSARRYDELLRRHF